MVTPKRRAPYRLCVCVCIGEGGVHVKNQRGKDQVDDLIQQSHLLSQPLHLGFELCGVWQALPC